MQGLETIAIIDDARIVSPAAPDLKSITISPRKPGIFGPGDVAQVFSADFLDADICRRWVIDHLHPSGAYCPDCDARVPDKFLNRFHSGDRIRCGCGRFFTVLSGTFLSGCQLDFRAVILLAVLLFHGVNDKMIAKYLKMSPANARLWRQKFEALDTLRTREGIVPWVNDKQSDVSLTESTTSSKPGCFAGWE